MGVWICVKTVYYNMTDSAEARPFFMANHRSTTKLASRLSKYINGVLLFFQNKSGDQEILIPSFLDSLECSINETDKAEEFGIITRELKNNREI